MNKEALTSVAGYLFIIFWVLGDMWDKPQREQYLKNTRRKQRHRARRTPWKGLVIPAEREEVGPEVQSLFALTGSSENWPRKFWSNGQRELH